MIENLLTIDQACEILAVRKKWLLQQVTDKKIRAIKMGHQTIRFREADLAAFIESSYINA